MFAVISEKNFDTLKEDATKTPIFSRQEGEGVIYGSFSLFFIQELQPSFMHTPLYPLPIFSLSFTPPPHGGGLTCLSLFFLGL